MSGRVLGYRDSSNVGFRARRVAQVVARSTRTPSHILGRVSPIWSGHITIRACVTPQSQRPSAAVALDSPMPQLSCRLTHAVSVARLTSLVDATVHGAAGVPNRRSTCPEPLGWSDRRECVADRGLACSRPHLRPIEPSSWRPARGSGERLKISARNLQEFCKASATICLWQQATGCPQSECV
jgi:hypothetical protein